MSSDKVTSEQRKGIHDRARKIGYKEGVRSGVNQIASYLGPDVGNLMLSALGIALDASEQEPTQRTRFDRVDWQKLGATTLNDLQLLTHEELAATQSSLDEGAVFADAVVTGLTVFNLYR